MNKQIFLINIFTQKNLIKNPPNFPDLTFLFETLWGIITERVKNELPENLEELTKYMFDE